LPEIWSFANFTLNSARACLLRDGQEVKLRPKSYEALKYLVENPGRVVTKSELIQEVWPDSFVTDDSLVQCMHDIRRALGDEAQRHIKTVPRRGYIFEAEIRTPEPTPAKAIYSEKIEGVRLVIEEESELVEDRLEPRTEAASAAALVAPSLFRGKRRLNWKAPAVGFVVVAAIVVLFLTIRPRPNEQRSSKAAILSGVKSMAVLPFKPLGADESDKYLGLGIADTLITRLGSTKEITVRPTSAIQKYTSSDQDSLAAGREQRVDTVLEGSIQKAGDKVRITARLINVQDGSTLWTYKTDQRFADVFTVQDAISEDLANALPLKLSTESTQVFAKRYTQNSEAYQLYIKGIFLRNQLTEDALKKSIECFQKAIELDPNYALAYAGQASSNSPLAYLGFITTKEAESRNRPLIARALQLDDRLAEAHTSSGELKLFIEWDWAGAEIELKRAIELKPNEPLAHHLYAALLVARQRFEEAIAESNRAFEIDPLSPRAGFARGWIFYLAGRYDQAIDQFSKTRELFPQYGLVNLGPSYEQKGMYAQAVTENLDAEARWGMAAEDISALRQASARAGWTGYWQKMLEIAQAQAKPEPASYMAELFARVGKKDKAFEWLEKAYEQRDMSLIYLKVFPPWESLRSDPRFTNLLQRLGLIS
jgi:DNA-binding winged helix-turn-helix (wHTH) protein/TolB-like protein